MTTELNEVGRFYASSRGAVAALMLRDRLALLWPPAGLAGQTVLGLGHATPYLRIWREAAGRCVHLSPAQLGAARWPAGSANLSCMAEEDALPFADLSIDRVVMVHGLEAADHARRLLREVWRVLRDDGRLLVVAPNRRGLWAHAEGTPFGQGAPYSPGQLERLLRDALFAVERRDTALFLPPLSSRLVLRHARLWEAGGRRLVPQLAGVVLCEAAKDAYAAVPGRPVARRRLVLAPA